MNKTTLLGKCVRDDKKCLFRPKDMFIYLLYTILFKYYIIVSSEEEVVVGVDTNTLDTWMAVVGVVDIF